MSKVNILIGSVLALVFGYYTYSVFLAEDALVNRSEITNLENGGYEIVTTRLDGSEITETYQISAAGDPLSHELVFQSKEPGSEPTFIKQGTFVPKHQ